MTGTFARLLLFLNPGETDEGSGMDNQRIQGGLRKATGTIKEKAGQITGDRQTEAEGKAEKAEGSVRSAVGHVKDAVREIVGKK
jgi:uncharacterized protein YjbJ (UPF0337 family)